MAEPRFTPEVRARSALTFNYTVAAGESTASLAATAVSLASGVTIKDSAGNAASLSLAGLAQHGPQIDSVTPTVTSLVASPATGDLNAGKTVTLTLDFSEAVTVAGVGPTLTLNDGGTATYVSGSGSKALTFKYTVAAGQNIASLAALWVNLASGVDDQGQRRQRRQSVARWPDAELGRRSIRQRRRSRGSAIRRRPAI